MLLCIRLQLLLVIVPPPAAAAAGEAEEEIHQNSLPLHRNLHAIERSQLKRGHNARSQSAAIKLYGNAPRSKWGHIQLNSVRNKSARYKKGQPPVLLLIAEIYLSMEMIYGTIIGIHTFTRRSLSFPTTHRNTLQLFHWSITGDPLTPSVPLPSPSSVHQITPSVQLHPVEETRKSGGQLSRVSDGSSSSVFIRRQLLI